MNNQCKNLWTDIIEEYNQGISRKNTMNTLLEFFGLSTRLLILGVIVFAAVTYLPSATVTMRNRLIITVTVVIIYAMLDVLYNMFGGVRNWLCDVACPRDEPEFTFQNLDL